MSSKKKNDKAAPNIRDSGCPISEKPAEYVAAEELARIRRALEEIVSLMQSQARPCPGQYEWRRYPAPLGGWPDKPADWPFVNWDGTPRVYC